MEDIHSLPAPMEPENQPRKRRRGAREASSKPKPAKTYNNPYAATLPLASSGSKVAGAIEGRVEGRVEPAKKKRPGKLIKKGDADYLSPTQLRNARKRTHDAAAKALISASAPVIGLVPTVVLPNKHSLW